MGRVGALLAGTALALFTQWPAWDTAPALAVVNTVVTVAFVLTGVLMAQHREQRGNGRLLAVAGSRGPASGSTDGTPRCCR